MVLDSLPRCARGELRPHGCFLLSLGLALLLLFVRGSGKTYIALLDPVVVDDVVFVVDDCRTGPCKCLAMNTE